MPRITSINSFIKHIYHRKYQSVCTCCVGKNQSGKTDFNLLQMERVHDLGLAEGFGSNLHLETDFEIDFVEDFQTLKKHCKMLNPNPGKKGIKRYFFLGSEIGKWAPRDQAWKNVDLIEEMQTIRKYGLSLLTDAIDRVDARILNRRFFHGLFEKISKANPQFAIYKDWENGETWQLRDIPKTRIIFDTWESPNFYMEPQVPENAIVPLNPEHRIVKKYLEFGSWKSADIHPQEGKRAVSKVLEYHMKHCLHTIQEPIENKEVSEAVTDN